VATQSWVAVHDDESLAAHMIQHLLLIMTALAIWLAVAMVTEPGKAFEAG
jgi:cytochrome c oxidase assembly factor CtaG